MARFSKGDKVKFLNEKGGGIITRVIDSNMVMVMNEDGFEIPTLMRNVLLEVAAEPAKEPNQPAPSPMRKTSFTDLMPGIHLAYVMTPGTKIAGAADLYIINNTRFDILFNVFRYDEGNYTGFDYGSCGPKATILVQACPENSNDRLLRGIVQILFHSFSPGALPNPLQADFKVKATRLLEETNYSTTNLFDAPAILIHLGTPDQVAPISEKQIVTPQPNRRERLLKPYITSEGLAVVDLHLEKLLEDVRNISSAEALQIQIGHFDAILAAAMESGISKVIFIHGVGNGILKSEIRRKLSEMEGVIFYDAPLMHYGVGATEVSLA